jgi:hypothetical protein
VRCTSVHALYLRTPAQVACPSIVKVLGGWAAAQDVDHEEAPKRQRRG